MSMNPDIYLLYEYMEKVPFTVRTLCVRIVVSEESKLLW